MNNNINLKSISNCKKGLIYYFSGTGNTSYIVNKYIKLFKEKNIEVETQQINNIQTISSQSKFDFVAFAYPTYCWQPPKFVIEFLKKLPPVVSKPCFILTTTSASAGGAINTAQNILIKKNYFVCGGYSYIMPNNASFIDKNCEYKKTIETKIENAIKKVNFNFDQLINNVIYIEKTNFVFTILSKLIAGFFNKFMIHKKHWIVDEKCIQCGLCEQICPMNNITVKHKKKKVIFDNKCVFCARCYNLCPQKAIQYKSNKDETKNFGRYDHLKDEIL